MSNRPERIAIIGGGIQGSSIAFHLCQSKKFAVTIFDPDPLSGASQVAAGMLAPVAEAVYGEETLLDLMLESASYWGELAAQLKSDFDTEVGYRDEGSLLVGVTNNDIAEIERTYNYYQSLQLQCELVRPNQMRELEPTLSPSIALGIYTKLDTQVDNRRAHLGLMDASLALGAKLKHHRAISISKASNGYELEFENSKRESFDLVVLSAGIDSFKIPGTPKFLENSLRPIRGQVLRLHTKEPKFGPSLVIRTLFDKRHTYIVPRDNGEVVIGASVEEFGLDRLTRARSTFELLRDGLWVIPQLGEYNLSEINVGFRPVASDNFPLLGFIDDNLVVATGHFRHGILLSSTTGKYIAKLIETGTTPTQIQKFSPLRFSGNKHTKISAGI